MNLKERPDGEIDRVPLRYDRSEQTGRQFPTPETLIFAVPTNHSTFHVNAVSIQPF